MASGYRPAAEPHTFFFARRGEPVPLRTRLGPRGVLLEMAHYCEIVPRQRDSHEVRTPSYWYRLLDRQEHELLAYHWHPEGVSPITFPHLHLSSQVRPIAIGPGADPVALAEMHLPTGQVTLADIVRLLITEFAVQPRRDDWETVLQENLAR